MDAKVLQQYFYIEPQLQPNLDPQQTQARSIVGVARANLPLLYRAEHSGACYGYIL